MNNIMNLLMVFLLPALCSANFFNNFTNLVSYSYVGENCAVNPVSVNVSDTVSCLPFQNISVCCKDLMKKNNFEGPLNICYNKNGNSSFSSCYEQHLTKAQTNGLGALSVFGVIFFLFMSIYCMYVLYSCCCVSNSSMRLRNREYKGLNH